MGLSVAVCRGFLSNIKIQAMNLEYQRHLATLIMLKEAGELDGATDEEVACGLRVDLEKCQTMKAYWIGKKIIDADYNFLASKRKPAPPGSSAARVRKHRANKKAMLECNASCNASCNAQNEALHEALQDPGVTPFVTLDVTPVVTPEYSAMDSAEPLNPASGNGETPDCNAQTAGVTSVPASGHVNVDVKRHRYKENVNGEGEGDEVVELAGGRVALLRDAEKGIPRQMLIPGGPRIEIPKDFTRQLTALTGEIPEKFRKEKEMETLRKLLRDFGYEHVYWNIRYVLKQLEKKPLKKTFWGYLRDACRANWGEELRVETLALKQAREEERIQLESRQRAEEEQVERVRHERELSAEAKQLLAVLPAEELKQLEKEAVALMEPADRRLAGRGDLGPKLVRNAVLVLVMRRIDSGEMGGREPPEKARENSARAPSRKRKAGDPPS